MRNGPTASTGHDPQRRHWISAGTALFAAAAGAAGWPVESGASLVDWRPSRPPALRATDLRTGEPRTLADLSGRPLLVNLWASWCAPCRLELPSLNALARRAPPDGLRLVTVNHGEMPARVEAFLRDTPIDGLVLLDRSQSLLAAWGARGLPASFVLDSRGRPRWWSQGERDWLQEPDASRLLALR